MNLQKEPMYVKLPDNESLAALNEYKQLLLSLMDKKVLSLTTFGGNTDYLCNSSLEEIVFKNEITSIINSTVIKLPHFSVYAGIIISSMLIKLWSDGIENVGLQKMTENLLRFKDILDEALNSLKFCSVDILSVASLQHNLKKLLLQEPAFLLSRESLNKLSFEIVKGVFSKVSAHDGFNVGQIHIHVKNGHEYFSMINGVVCEVDDTTSCLIKSAISKLNANNKMLLFSENICESDRFMLMLNVMVHTKIKLILCQKKISDSLKVVLRRNGIIAVERIGLDTAKSIEQITSCVPIEDINGVEINSIPSYVGYFSTLNLKNLNGSNHMIVEKIGCSVSTLYVSCRSFSSTSCTKKICSNSIKFVYSMIATPYLFPGPITFEEKLTEWLKNKVVGCEVMTGIISAFCSVLNEIKVLYKDSKCDYGSFDDTESNWDCFHLKKNALICSLDGIINCLSIGLIVRI